MSDELAIRLRAVVKRYGAITAVNGLDLEVPVGTCVGLLGPNGAGKSTTMRLLTAQSIADEGELEVLGFRLPGESKAARAQCGVVPQLDNLDVTLTVEQNLLVFTHLYRIGRAERREAIERALKMANLVDRRDTKVNKLSGGMRRRLLIARALVHRPRLVLLDEPTVGLDPQVRQELWALIDALRSEGTTILMSTHYIEEAQRLADTVLIMAHGSAVAHHLCALGGQGVDRQREADETLAHRDVRERPLSDEVFFVLLDDPRHAGSDQIRLRIGVLTDDHVCLLETEHALRLEPERSRAACDQGVPQMLGDTRRAVQLVAELADEADAKRQARHTGDADLLRVEILERFVGDICVRQLRQSVARLRPREIQRRERAGDVDDLRVVAPDRVPPLEPLADAVRAGRRRRDVEELVAEPSDRAVVHDPAGVGRQHSVANAACLQIAEAIRV